ncbi:MAG: hypothetical protein SF123_15715 [Chloroflexota bacterium]|nr:hypothetical protein [Chloroflexota bacterium]
MSEGLRYHTLDELRALSLDELRALWELVPTDRQRAYRAAYERELQAAGAEGSDAKEYRIALALLKRYETAALVPLGSRWARAPGRVQAAARAGEALDATDERTPKASAPPKAVIAVLGVLLLGMMALLLTRPGGDTESSVATRTLIGAPTLTPLALEAQDEVIEGGDADRAPFYPISLQAVLPDGGAPRVWVVQRRRVSASEWRYDANPDTASYLSGMHVRPVIGIPWSEENAAWFAQASAGAAFHVQMNTGAVLTFVFEERRAVRRSDIDLFRQIAPGLVLLLLGETDADSLPTATRTTILARYAPEQELARTSPHAALSDAALSSLLLPTARPTVPVPTATPVPFAGLDAQVITVTTQPERLTAQLRLYNGGTMPLRFTPDDLWLTLGYAELPPGPRLPAAGLSPFDLLPGQAADVTLVWPWAGEPYGVLAVGGRLFAIRTSG